VNLIAQVVVGNPSGLGIIQLVVIVAILGLIAGLIDRAPVIDANFKAIIKWLCVGLAVILVVFALLRWAQLA